MTFKQKLNTKLVIALQAFLLIFVFVTCGSDDEPELVNNAPSVKRALPDQVLQEGFEILTVDFSAVFLDEDGDQFTFEASSSNTDIITTSIANEVLTITEVGAGTATINLSASDGNGGSASDNFSITVNRAPIVSSSLTDLTLDEGFETESIDISGVFSDEDGDALTVEGSSSNTAVVTITIANNTITISEVGVGSSTITLTVSDGNGGTVSDDFILAVNESTNIPPNVVTALVDVTVDEGFGTHVIDFSTSFADADGDALTYTATSSDENVATTSISGTSLTITEAGDGTATIKVTAQDGNGGMVSDEFILTVTPAPNTAPTVANALGDVTLGGGFGTNVIDITDTFADADGDALTYTTTSSDENVATTSISGTSLTITEVATGTSTINITAIDGNGGTVSDEFVFTIDAAANNAPTVVNIIADMALEAGFGTSEVDIANTFTDADGDALSFAVESSNEAVATAAISGTTITITEVGVGSATITVSAFDDDQASVSDAFDVTVTETVIEPVTLTFGTVTGNSIAVSSWTTATADGYVVVISDASGISDRTDSEEPLYSTTYVGSGEQPIYVGSTSNALDITLLEDQQTYYFKVFPYTGNFVYDNSQDEQESTTTNCATSSTTVSEVCFDVTGDTRTISSNQYPSHAVGSFPNADPTAIAITRVLDLTPETAANVTYVFDETGMPTPMNQNFWQFGIATNGVEFHPMGLQPWENPGDGEQNWEWQVQVTEEGQVGLDAYGAHVTTQGNYHYHGDIVGLAVGENGSRHSLLYGFAGDGFPIYYKYGYVSANDPTSGIKELLSSHQLKSGSRTGTGTAGADYPDGTHDGTYIQDYEFVNGLGDLDECNGRTGVTPEFPGGTYYYVITADFPVTPNCFSGTPDSDWIIGN
jgi:uncharacterized protein YjdB